MRWPVGIGYVDWIAQFKALIGIGYSNTVNLETHWRGAGTPEASSIRSWEGMKKNLEKAGGDIASCPASGKEREKPAPGLPRGWP